MKATPFLRLGKKRDRDTRAVRSPLEEIACVRLAGNAQPSQRLGGTARALSAMLAVVIALSAAASSTVASDDPCMYLGNLEYTQVEVPMR